MALNATCLVLYLQGECTTALDIIKSNVTFAVDRNAEDFRTAREQVAAYRHNAVATLIEAGCQRSLAEKLVHANWASLVRMATLKQRVAKLEKAVRALPDYSTANAHFAAAKRARGEG